MKTREKTLTVYAPSLKKAHKKIRDDVAWALRKEDMQAYGWPRILNFEATLVSSKVRWDHSDPDDLEIEWVFQTKVTYE